MKNLKVVVAILSIGVSTVLAPSCSKEKGCTDPDSKNYSSTAEEDDGSCTYEGGVVFWYDQNTSAALVDDDAVSLTYYVDNQIIGSSAANVYWTSAPNCEQNGSISYTKDLGKVKTQSYTYKVIDQTGWEYFSGVVNVNANTCFKTQLTFSKMKRRK